jgi:hypothetical protein
VRAAVGFNRGGDPEDPKTDGELKSVVSLIRNRLKVEPEQLADEDVDLRRLTPAPPRVRSAERRRLRPNKMTGIAIKKATISINVFMYPVGLAFSCHARIFKSRLILTEI